MRLGVLVMLDLGERRVRGAHDHATHRVEARPVAWAVPGLLRAVPVHNAPQVRAHRRMLVANAAFVAIFRDLAEAAPHDGPFAWGDLFLRGYVAAAEPVLGVLLRDVQVLAQEFAPRHTPDRLPRRVVDLTPWVLSAHDQVR